jgi:hypothetical protein
VVAAGSACNPLGPGPTRSENPGLEILTDPVLIAPPRNPLRPS